MSIRVSRKEEERKKNRKKENKKMPLFLGEVTTSPKNFNQYE